MALLSLTEAGKKLKCNKETVRLWITRGVKVGDKRYSLKGHWIAGRWVVKGRELKQFLADVSEAKQNHAANINTWMDEQAEAARRLAL
jgi:hypothetical protein